MAKLPTPADDRPADRLSDDAKKLLRYLRDKGLDEMVFEGPGLLEAAFGDAAKCEAAERELANAGLIELGPERHRADPSVVRAAALTREGVRYIQNNPID